MYYDTDAESTAVTTALTIAGRRAPKPQGYAAQVLPHLWSFDVDLSEVPPEHPLQYLHPESARSVEEVTRDRLRTARVGRNVDAAMRAAWAINAETESAVERLVGRRDADEHPASAVSGGAETSADAVVIDVEEVDRTGDERAASSDADE